MAGERTCELGLTLVSVTDKARGTFCDGMRRYAVPEVHYQKDTKLNGVLEPLFPDIKRSM